MPNTSQPRHGTDLQRCAIHDHGVEGRFAGFVGRSAEAYRAIALVALARGAADFDGVEGRGGGAEEGGVGGCCGGREGAAPCVDDEGEAWGDLGPGVGEGEEGCKEGEGWEVHRESVACCVMLLR